MWPPGPSRGVGDGTLAPSTAGQDDDHTRGELLMPRFDPTRWMFTISAAAGTGPARATPVMQRYRATTRLIGQWHPRHVSTVHGRAR